MYEREDRRSTSLSLLVQFISTSSLLFSILIHNIKGLGYAACRSLFCLLVLLWIRLINLWCKDQFSRRRAGMEPAVKWL